MRDGEAGAARDIVALNAAGALVAAGVVEGFSEGVARAFDVIDTGAAATALDALVKTSCAAHDDEAT